MGTIQFLNNLIPLLQNYYELDYSNAEKLATKLIKDLENNYLEWSSIKCEWEVK